LVGRPAGLSLLVFVNPSESSPIIQMTTDANRSLGLRMAVLVEGGLALLALALGWLFRVPFREQLPSSVADLPAVVLRSVVATLPLLAAFWWLLHARWPAAQQLRQQVRQLVDELFHQATLAQLALVAVLAGVGEELLFRGVIQSLAAQWTTPLAGLLIAGLIFGLCHALSRLYFVLATLVGLYFGWLFWYFDDVAAVMIAHALYDFIALVNLSRWRW
jgi:membrane protease YdiL (CAAX protease family)